VPKASGRRKVRKRGWGAIVTDILEASLTPERKMRIMYKANLNFQRFDRYFKDLLAKGFVEKASDPDGSVLYRVSERGKTLLDALRKARDLAGSEEY